MDPNTIPNGYSKDRHRALKDTIAKPGDLSGIFAEQMKVMACHESQEDHCVGWLVNQIGPGNNLALRIRMFSCSNARDIRTVGEQHENFEDTLPN